MNTTYVDNINLTTMVCGECGITFAMPETFRKECQELGNSWHCPNGHSRIYSETDVSKLKRQLAKEESKHDQTSAKLRDTKIKLSCEKGQRTKLKNRIAKGVCPCCNRSFQNLKKHMDTKHPEYDKSKKRNGSFKTFTKKCTNDLHCKEHNSLF